MKRTNREEAARDLSRVVGTLERGFPIDPDSWQELAIHFALDVLAGKVELDAEFVDYPEAANA